MKSVTRIATTPGLQPRGGYINPKDMLEERIAQDLPADYEKKVADGYEKATLSPHIIGLVVDYLSRLEYFRIYDLQNDVDWGVEKSIRAAFRISLLGARLAGKTDEAERLVERLVDGYKTDKKEYKKITQAASELVTFDTMVRLGKYFEDAEKPKITDADAKLVKEMVRATTYYLWCKQSDSCPDVRYHARGAKNVLPSDADWLTDDSLIDLKCTKDGPKSTETFQLILYYILGKHELPASFADIKYLKLLNPRLCKVYSYEIDKLNKDDLKHIEKDIMGYKESVFDKPKDWYIGRDPFWYDII